MNKGSEVKCRVFRVEVKVQKEQTAGLLNRDTRFEPMTLIAGKRQDITNVAGEFTITPLQPPTCLLCLHVVIIS